MKYPSATRSLGGAGLWLLTFGIFLLSGPRLAQSSVDFSEDALLEAAKLGLNSDEFDDFTFTKLLISDGGVIKPFDHTEIRQRKRRGVADQTTLRVPVHGEVYVVNLFHPRQVLHPDADIILTDGDHQQKVDVVGSDCYLVGNVTSHGGSASFSYCHGMRGAFHTSDKDIVLLPVDGQDRHLVAVRKNKQNENGFYQAEIVNDFEDDTVEMRENTDEEASSLHNTAPNKPIDTSGKAVIEIAVYIDADYYKFMEAVGENTLAKKMDFIIVKWNAVQYEYSKKEQLGRVVEIQLKKMQFWKTNPVWLQVTNKLGSLLRSICQWNKDKEPFDTIYLHTGHSPISPLGLAYVGGACHKNNRCAVSADKMWGKYVAVAHELGHNLNMKHDGDTPCRDQPKAINGLMGGHGTNFSRCSVEAFKSFIQKGRGDCLFVENIHKPEPNMKGVTLNGLLPQMYHTFDDMCKHQVGPDYRYREWSFHTKYQCTNNHICVNMEHGKKYGLFKQINRKPGGQYCGNGKACYQGQCVPYKNFHIHVKVPVQKGQWVGWGPFSPCTRTCGTGVMVSQRKCQSPEPLNSADCPGNEYRAKLCNLKPCAQDSTKDPVKLANIRATEVCQNFVKSGVLSSSEFLEKGHVYNLKDTMMGCEVVCHPKKGRKRARMALLPDGSPCVKPNTDYTFPPNDEKVKYRCLKGVCQVFDCTNQFPPTTFGKNPKCTDDGGIIGWHRVSDADVRVYLENYADIYFKEVD